MVHLRSQLADKESEVAGLRAHLEEALREELADSDPARLRAAQKRAAALEADLAAKQVLPCPALKSHCTMAKYEMQRHEHSPQGSSSQGRHMVFTPLQHMTGNLGSCEAHAHEGDEFPAVSTYIQGGSACCTSNFLGPAM